MADSRSLPEIVESVRAEARANEARLKRRIALTFGMAVFAAGYLGWLHARFTELDANAVTEIARGQVEARLPDLGRRVSQMAVDAAPDLLDRAEEGLLSAPQTLRDAVEARLTSHVEGVLDEAAGAFDEQLAAVVEPAFAQVADAGGDSGPPPVEELMDALRARYREQVGGMVARVYTSYAERVASVDEYLRRLRSAGDLTVRERADREIIEASVALRRFHIDPVATPATEVGRVDDAE